MADKNADDKELVRNICLDCADDLARWERAFVAADEPLLATLLEGLKSHIRKRADELE
jgi:hypothetical protein